MVDAFVVDLPYYGIVKDEFDNQWHNVDDYIMWVMDGVKRGFGLLSELIKIVGTMILQLKESVVVVRAIK